MNSQNDIYDFLINEEEETMLLIYERDGEPQTPKFEFSQASGEAVLYRNNDDEIVLSDVPADVIDSLVDADSLLVCELTQVDNEEDTEVAFAYEADILN